MSYIHPTAIVSPNAKLESDIIVGPFAIIQDDVEIGERCEIGPNAVIYDFARIGNGVKIFQGASISNLPQDLKFDKGKTLLKIGDDTTVREFATLHRGTHATGETRIGKNCLLMAYTHVAHDCQIGDNCIISNGVQIAGHVEIEDSVIIGGLAAIHQFGKIGKHSMVGGGSMANMDVPPFIMTSGYPARFMGLNIVGLKRRGFSTDEIDGIKETYRLFYSSGLNPQAAKEKIMEKLGSQPHVQSILQFMEKSSRGLVRR
ncbi:MAG: acyl-[acyl-carrier-protein]--UDP-N-acetylglucosamine O-acyltransferase [Ignavibacteriae bacterium HGW-Ignavibacteriae-3]|nr:MAG: acyl-[acyl-carrier-protein]--UDP-N-acetylglucosamine O-acyltransferase [Ignavibacteriae bacterium HGW-Ignavibacteriae-3]